MKSYKDTINLPNTKFPMRGNLSQKEPETLNQWYKENIYKEIQNKNIKKKIFLLQDGPPYANGNIHIGHAVNKILKDIIIKSKILSGFYVPYIPFWDCHGLPIEHQIEKKIYNKRNNITKLKFRSLCQKYAHEQVQKQKQDFIRLGIFADWDNAQLTMHPHLEYNVLVILRIMFEKKYLYHGSKPVHWCIKCQSAIAEAEVEYNQVNADSIMVMFQCIEKQKIKSIFLSSHTSHNIHIVIWTTTPWSLPANRAIAVHPKFQYQLVQFKKRFIIIAKELVEHVMQKIKITTWKIIHTIYGKELEHLKFQHPFLHYSIPIILSEHITLDSGTGIVHIAPDYGEDDYLVSKKYKIKLTNIINSNGQYINTLHPELNHQNVFKINNTIITLIQKNNCLLHYETIQHSYPHCWRHKYPIIYRTTKQWFIKLEHEQLREKCIKVIKNINWVPQWGHNNMYKMVINRPDWCISRQRTWGVPIPFFIHKETGKLHPNSVSILNKIINIVKSKGSEEWWKIDQKKFLGDEYHQYEKSEDILDVWFESGCIHNLKLENNKLQQPVYNIYLEGSDQYRGWFMSSLIISMIINQSPPYQEVITHGFVIDKSGAKMSKSLGNVITPTEIVKIFGADVLRLWVASTNYTHDIIISTNTLQQTSEQYRRIRNTCRFLLGNIYDFNPQSEKISFPNMVAIDQWIIQKTTNVQKKIIELYNNYKFHELIKKIIKFCSIDLGSFYLDIIKNRQYTTQKNSIARKSCQTAMYYIIQSLVRWITPILPFTAYEIWNNIPNNQQKNIFVSEWFEIPTNMESTKIISDKQWKELFLLREEINKSIENKKKQNKISNSLETMVIIYANSDLYNICIMLRTELKFMFLVSNTIVKKYKLFKNHIDNIQRKSFKITIKKYLGIKCPRCWNYFNKINVNQIDKNICNRCEKNIHQNGEQRKFL